MKYFNTIPKSKNDRNYPQLLIETIADLKLFIFHDVQIRSKQAATFWTSFKSQSYKTSPVDYYQHEKECKNTLIQGYMATEIELNGVASLIDYCNKADKLLALKYEGMASIINRGEIVRTNHLGGFSPYEEGMFERGEIIEVTDSEQVKNFILSGELSMPMSITKKCLVIENGDHSPQELIKKVIDSSTLTNEEIQVENTFKLKTLLWTEKEYVEYFKNGILQGMNTIAFESTFQDMAQFKKLKALLEGLISKIKTSITVYIKAPCLQEVQDMLAMMQKETQNVNIVLI